MKRDKYDTLWSDLVREAADWTCERCGREFPERKSQAFHCSHYIGRRYQATRFAPDNCFGLCYPCHNYLGERPHDHKAWAMDQLGVHRYEKLIALGRTTVRRRKAEKESMHKHHREELARILKDRKRGVVGAVAIMPYD